MARVKFPKRKCSAEQRFVEHALTELQESGVRVVILPPRNYGGDYRSGRLRVGIRHDAWFLVFLHEYCHFLQDRDKTPWFADPAVIRSWNIFFEWLDGAPANAREVLRATRCIQSCELDCERRVIRLIKRHKFTSICPSYYASAANIYIWQYEAARLFRAWNKPERPPNNIARLHKLCPDKLIRVSQLHKVPDGYLDIYKRCAQRTRYFTAV